MLLIPNAVFSRYAAHLNTRGVAPAQHADYKKWLRYFLDFCNKYPVPASKSERVRLFCEKLRGKKQSERLLEQAAHALSLYFEMEQQASLKQSQENFPFEPGQKVMKPVEPTEGETAAKKISLKSDEELHQAPELRSSSQFSEAGYQVKSKSLEWDDLLAQMAAEIKVRHYSRKTLKTYANWSRQFQRFLKDKPPQELTTEDVKEYLTFLAVKCNVAASTQNQAFNSLLFLFRHGLKREFGALRGVPRAKKSLYIPMVLSREEIDAILVHLSYPYNLVVKLLFGCGLRQFECLQLRVRDFNFDAGKLTIHGKGKKDRTVPLPEAMASPRIRPPESAQPAVTPHSCA